MRRLLALALTLLACSNGGSDPPVSQDSGDELTCPPALGTARPRAEKPIKGPLDDLLRINQLQAKATHNSYHLRPDGGVVDWRYSHAPLATQLESQGVRGVELDVRYDEDCGRYEVFHLPLLDERTTCRVFTDCLTALRTWSDAHPSHHVLFVHIEPKDGYDEATGEARFAALEREVLSVFPRELVVTPDEVKGAQKTLRDAVLAGGWPTLGATRGRVLFYIDRSDAWRDAYTHGRKDLDGRLMFTDADEGDPFAAVLVRNGALTDETTIAGLVKKGFLVRTFADKSVEGALADDRSQIEPALRSGAQIVSTDFPAKVPETNYFFEMPGGAPSRCNPLTAPGECTSSAIESLPK